MDDRLREMLRELGNAINESISGSHDVNDQMQRIRDEGYDLYVVLDATIGLGRPGESMNPVDFHTEEERDEPVPAPLHEAQFRINVNDLALLRGLGIDPTRKVKVSKRLTSKVRQEDE